MKHCQTCRCDERNASAEFPRAAIYWLMHYGDGVPIAVIADRFEMAKSTVAQVVRGINSAMGLTRIPSVSARLRAAGALPWTKVGSHRHHGASAVLTAPDDALDADLMIGLSR